jgi:hypothetical protein
MVFFLTACGSGKEEVLYIQTHTSIIKVGDRISLSALATEVLGSQPEWEVIELDGGSLIRTSGQQVTYIAPQHAGRYHIAATAARVGGQTVRAVQRIIVQPQLAIEPASVKLGMGESFAFSLNVKGIEPPRIRWSIDEPEGGSIAATGLYTAPFRAGIYNVVATAMTEGQPMAMATVQVQ